MGYLLILLKSNFDFFQDLLFNKFSLNHENLENTKYDAEGFIESFIKKREDLIKDLIEVNQGQTESLIRSNQDSIIEDERYIEDLKMLYYADLNSPKIDLEISCNRIEELAKIQGSLMEAFFKSSYNLIDLIKASKVQKDFIEIVKKEDNFASILNKFSIECASIPKDGPNSSFYAKTEMARLKSINIRAGERREKDFFKICQELNQTYFQKRYSRDLIGEEKIVYFPEEENLLLRE